MPPRKKKTPEIPVVEEEVFPDPPVSQEETFTFKRTHFYAVFTVLAFAAGVLLGYVVWGYNTQPTTVFVQAPVSPTPQPVVYDIETAGFPSLGPADAPIVIVEFSDYQCPYCYRWYAQVYKPLLEAYEGKIRFVYHNYPLSFHENAFPSAEAALCAGDQNAYWEYHNALFDHYPTMYNQEGVILDQETYNKFARDIGLKVDVFEECMSSHKYQQFILDDIKYAESLAPENGEAAVGGTPTFFINGHRLGGAYPLEAFQEIIEAELAKSN
jgi:protein-disulfide isomerase